MSVLRNQHGGQKDAIRLNATPTALEGRRCTASRLVTGPAGGTGCVYPPDEAVKASNHATPRRRRAVL